MLKALIKKQMLEINQYYFINRKTGKQRSKGEVALIVGVFVLLFLFLGLAFYMMGAFMCSMFVEAGFGFLYPVIMGMASILMGVFGSVFNTYASLYRAKDNEMLLAMPIPMRHILAARLLGVIAMALLYSALVWIPAVVCYAVTCASFGMPIGAPIACGVVELVGIVALVSALTCVLGWVVAIVADKMKRKSFVVTLLSVAFFFLYYWVYFQASTFIQELLANAAQVSGVVSTWMWPLYQMGLGATGDFVATLLFLLVCVVVCAVVFVVLERTFGRIIATKGVKAEKKKYQTTQVKATGVSQALLRRELRRFAASSAYMLNCGFGVIILVVAAVASLAFSGDMRAVVDMLAAEMPDLVPVIPVAVVAIVVMIAGMGATAVPSVSLEGKSLWIVRSLPVTSWQILNAKRNVQILLNLAPTLLFAACVPVALGFDLETIAAIVVASVAFVLASANVSLFLGLRFANLSWTNEVVPIKQSAGMFIAIFGSWIVGILVAGIYLALGATMPPSEYLLFVMAAFVLVAALMQRWLVFSGVRRFEEL